MSLHHRVSGTGIDSKAKAEAEFWSYQERYRAKRPGDPRDHIAIESIDEEGSKAGLSFVVNYGVKAPKAIGPAKVEVKAAGLPNAKDCEGCPAFSRDDCANGNRPGTCPDKPHVRNERPAPVEIHVGAATPPNRALPSRGPEPLPAKTMIPLDRIVITGENPRATMDEEQLKGLISSIKEVGQREPVNVRPLPDGRYELFSGHRRIRALRELGKTEAWAVVEEIDEKDRKLLMGVHNLNREDLNPADLARWLDDTLREHPEMSQETLARICGHHQAWISNHLRLLKAPEELRAMIISQEITPAHVQILLPITDKPEYGKVLALMKENVRDNGGITVKRLQHLIDDLRSERDIPATKDFASSARSQQPAEVDEEGSPAESPTEEETTVEDGPAAALEGKEHETRGHWSCRVSSGFCYSWTACDDPNDDVASMLRHLFIESGASVKAHEAARLRVCRCIREGGNTWDLLQKLFSKEMI